MEGIIYQIKSYNIITFIFAKIQDVLKRTYLAEVQVHIHILCLYWDMFPCFNVQKTLYFSHTACAAAPLFTLCLKPESALIG